MFKGTRSAIFCLVGAFLYLEGQAHALVITFPKNGETFKEGDTLKIVAELSPDDPEIADVSFLVTKGIDHCPSAIATHPRYECSFIIPPGAPSVITITAIGETIESAVFSPEVSIRVTRANMATLQGIKIFTGNTSNKLFFFQIGQNKRLHVDGIYSDGVKREELSSAAAGTTYTSTDEKVVTVDRDGLVTAQGFGTARITIKNGKYQTTVEATVKPEPTP